jgi:predicted nucleic acid-binding protein
MTPVLVDTGFLVALFDPADALAASAASYLKAHRHQLVATTAPVIEASFFLGPGTKADLLAWIRRGGMEVVEVPATAYAQLEMTLRKYSDQEIDFADAALVWLAGETGANQVLTVDRKDFEIFRLKGGKRFEVIDWF